jgi:hypothetical protein
MGQHLVFYLIYLTDCQFDFCDFGFDMSLLSSLLKNYSCVIISPKAVQGGSVYGAWSIPLGFFGTFWKLRGRTF